MYVNWYIQDSLVTLKKYIKIDMTKDNQLLWHLDPLVVLHVMAVYQLLLLTAFSIQFIILSLECLFAKKYAFIKLSHPNHRTSTPKFWQKKLE